MPTVAALASCGSSGGQLQVSISSSDAAGSNGADYKASDATTFARYKPGDLATLTVTVVNAGPGSISGVTVHVSLPPAFRYRATTGVFAPGSTRTQPIDPQVNSSTPIFGLWTIGQPGANGPGTTSKVEITFTAEAEGLPGNVVVQAAAAGDTSSGQVTAQPYNLVMTAAAKLSVLVSVNPTSERRGGTVTYEVRVSNSGTGNADDVGVLVTLPPVLTFASSITPFAGNGTRNKGVNPIANSLEVYYDGFLLPANSNAGPGFVVVVFKANVLGGRSTASSSPTASPGAGVPSAAPSTVPPGTYPVDVQVTDQAGDVVRLDQVAPLVVT